MQDIRLHYIEKGTGFPLILLHGNGEEHGYFEYQIEYFSKEYRVIAIDTRGHGKTPRGEAPFTIRQFAEDLKCFLDEMGIEKAHILGFSDGGNIAMIFAMRYPQYVNKLILNGANLNGSGVKFSVQFPIILGYKIASLFAAKKPDAKKNAEMLGLMVNDPNVPTAELAKIKVPTLVVAGTKDMIREDHTRLIAEKIPGAKLALIPGDHFVAAKNSNTFNQTVEAFLRK